MAYLTSVRGAALDNQLSRKMIREKNLLSCFTMPVLACLLSACLAQKQPDLTRLYQQANQVKQPPVIVIHGILGGKLRLKDSLQELWYGGFGKLLFSDFSELALEIDPGNLQPMDDHLQAYAITDKAAGRDFYGEILNTLETAGGYQAAQPGQAQSSQARNYYVFVYDWRRDNVESAQQLNQLIEQIRLDYADPKLRVDVIAHSMGGLVTRYFLRYGAQDVLNGNDFSVNLAGAEKVRRVVLLGTPNLGSVHSLHAFIKGFKIGLRSLPTEALATMPSVYQLFPHALNSWIVSSDGKSLRRDLFDINTWRRFQWSIFDPVVKQRIAARFKQPQEARAYQRLLESYFEKNLERARRFVWSLTIPLPQTPYKIIVFGGDCELTPARLLVEEVLGKSEIRLWPNEIKYPKPGINYNELMLEPGDGTVTKASLLARETLDSSVPRHKYSFFPLHYPFFICEKHDQLTGNITFQNNLLHTLLSLDSE